MKTKITSLNLFPYISKGYTNHLFCGMKTDQLISKFGSPRKIESFESGDQFWYYSNLRLTINNFYVQTIVFFFSKRSHNFVFKKGLDKTYDFTQLYKVNDFVFLLNEYKLRWRGSRNWFDPDTISISTNKKTMCIFSAKSFRLTQIIISNNISHW